MMDLQQDSLPASLRGLSGANRSAHPTSPSRLVLLGATGRTGMPLLLNALERGHSVTVLVRSPSKLPPKVVDHPRLRILIGEVGNQALMAEIMDSVQPHAVISTLASETAPFNAVSTATRNLIRALTLMRETSGASAPLPFVSIAGWGMGPTSEHVTGVLPRLLVKLAMTTFWAKAGADFLQQFADLDKARASGLLQPLMILPPVLVDGEASRDYLAGDADAMRSHMGVTKVARRASIADLCLKVAEQAQAGASLPQWIAIRER